MIASAKHFGQFLAVLALTGLAQSCFMLPPDPTPAPTLDVVESPALLARAQGSVVVADGYSDKLFVISLPGGKRDEIPTEGTAMVASGIDAEGRVVYVRESKMWMFLLTFFLVKGHYSLVEKSLITGEERVLCEVGRGQWEQPFEFEISLAGGRAMYSYKSRGPKVVELASGHALELSWWDLSLRPLRLSGDGSSVICEAPWDRFISIDLTTRRRTIVGQGKLSALDPDGRVIRVGTERKPLSWESSEPDANELPGWLGLGRPWTFIDDRLAIYEGLGTPSSAPMDRSWGLRAIEHSIRLGDIESHETVTLLPRFLDGSVAYSRHGLPPKAAR